MSIFKKRYVRVIVNGETYYREVSDDNELGVRIAEDEFNTIILDTVYNDIVIDEFLVDLVQVQTIIDRMPNIHDRKIMNKFYQYVLRIDGEQ
ncbi:hypothetical protein [Lysinibacillus sp.]|uniref:hypothetical protein n=1 Tax=Lysinibacillus sp. TaxID=1869345 RepID=UPI00289FAC1F|nr:hypothetical protein [Lysinibacillus sp.]